MRAALRGFHRFTQIKERRHSCRLWAFFPAPPQADKNVRAPFRYRQGFRSHTLESAIIRAIRVKVFPLTCSSDSRLATNRPCRIPGSTSLCPGNNPCRGNGRRFDKRRIFRTLRKQLLRQQFCRWASPVFLRWMNSQTFSFPVLQSFRLKQLQNCRGVR